MVEPLALVVYEEKEFVLDHRTTQRSPEHVPTHRRSRERRSIRIDLVFPLVGIQPVIPEELPDVAVKTVGAGLDRGTHNAAHETTEFRRGVITDEIEFLDGVGRGGEAE